MSTRYGFILCLLLTLGLPSHADSVERASEASRLSAIATQMSVKGSAELLSAGGDLMVSAVETSGAGLRVVLTTSAAGTEAVIIFGSQTAGGLSLAVGDSVKLTASAAGYLLLKGGEVIAFIPSEIARGLIHHSDVAAPK
jgi:hypothetical protein